MAPDLRTPGVYREEAFVRATEELPTGVPGFVGLGVALDARGVPSQEPQELLHADQLAGRWVPRANGRSYLAEAVKGFFANGGTRCHVVGAGDPELALPPDEDGGAARLIDTIKKRLPHLDVDLVAVPDAMTLPQADAVRVQREALDHCADQGNRFAILDAPRIDPDAADVEANLKGWRDGVLTGAKNPANAALYFPWLVAVDPPGPVPPCGHVAGIFARSDARLGVFKAPANEELAGVASLDFVLDGQTHGDLNVESINCLRALPGRGLRVLGARTLSRDPSWSYLNVRRTFLTLARWIDRNMAWAPFEPNTPRLWNRLSRELTGYLRKLWQQGALQGATAQEAFFVKCDAETNPQDARDRGEVTTEVGLAPASPAEFIVVHVTQRAGSTQLS